MTKSFVNFQEGCAKRSKGQLLALRMILSENISNGINAKRNKKKLKHIDELLSGAPDTFSASTNPPKTVSTGIKATLLFVFFALSIQSLALTAIICWQAKTIQQISAGEQ